MNNNQKLPIQEQIRNNRVKELFSKKNVKQERETITQFAENQKLERTEYWRKLAERTR